MKEQMSTVIAELSKIETDALAIIADTETRQKSFAQEIDLQKKDFDDKLNAKTDEKLKAISEELNQRTAEDLTVLKREAQEQMYSLETSFQKSHTAWAKEVLDSIIKE